MFNSAKLGESNGKSKVTKPQLLRFTKYLLFLSFCKIQRYIASNHLLFSYSYVQKTSVTRQLHAISSLGFQAMKAATTYAATIFNNHFRCAYPGFYSAGHVCCFLFSCWFENGAVEHWGYVATSCAFPHLPLLHGNDRMSISSK